MKSRAPLSAGILTLLAALLSARTASADDAKPASKPAASAPVPAERIRELAKDLGSDDLAAREKAEAGLLSAGEAAVAHLQKLATSSEDPEVCERAKRICEEIGWSSLAAKVEGGEAVSGVRLKLVAPRDAFDREHPPSFRLLYLNESDKDRTYIPIQGIKILSPTGGATAPIHQAEIEIKRIHGKSMGLEDGVEELPFMARRAEKQEPPAPERLKPGDSRTILLNGGVISQEQAAEVQTQLAEAAAAGRSGQQTFRIPALPPGEYEIRATYFSRRLFQGCPKDLVSNPVRFKVAEK